jgi:hypothetical protein
MLINDSALFNLIHQFRTPLFSANFDETFSKATIWLFWNSTFFVFWNFDPKPKYQQWKFLILFYAESMLNLNILNFWDISTCFWVICEYISNFLTVRLTVQNFFGSNTVFLTKTFVEFEPEELSLFCFFPLKAEIHAFYAKKILHG